MKLGGPLIHGQRFWLETSSRPADSGPTHSARGSVVEHLGNLDPNAVEDIVAYAEHATSNTTLTEHWEAGNFEPGRWGYLCLVRSLRLLVGSRRHDESHHSESCVQRDVLAALTDAQTWFPRRFNGSLADHTETPAVDSSATLAALRSVRRLSLLQRMLSCDSDDVINDFVTKRLPQCQIRHTPSPEGPCGKYLVPWLLPRFESFVRDQIRTYLRQRKQKPSEVRLAAATHVASPQREDPEVQTLLRQCFALAQWSDLPILWGRARQRLPHSLLAFIWDISETASRARICRARKKLRKALGGNPVLVIAGNV